MITAEQLIAAGIPVSPGNPVAALHAEAALDWMQAHTTIEFDKADTASIEALPACAKVFVLKYAETMRIKAGVTSQSIEGLSQSFDTSGNANSLIWATANALLGDYLKSQVRVTPAKRRW